MPNFGSGVKYIFFFVCMASYDVYYTFQDCIYIPLFGIIYVIGYLISSQNCLCLLNSQVTALTRIHFNFLSNLLK